MRSTVYSDIVSMFYMDKRPKGVFDPQNVVFKELVEYALVKSFNDFNFRTLTKTDAFEKEYTDWEARENAIRKKQKQNKEPQNSEPTMTIYLIKRLDVCGFLDRFVDYFKATSRDQTAFDNWHNKTCMMFLNVLDGAEDFVKYTKVYNGLAYGKAQKIVNMMFKHLYCLNGADAYKDYFKYCHMVLDNFTLEWFKREVGEKRIVSWSNLIYKEPFADHNDYMFYQEKIRKYFMPTTSSKHTYIGLTPFQAEFYIWPEIQLHLATEALFGQNIGRDAAMDYADQHYAVKPNSNEFGEATRNFSLYTDMFRKLPLEDKMHFLKERMEQMLTTINNDPSTSESFEVRFEYENAKECLDAFSNGIAIFIPEVDNIEENKKYTTIRNYITKYNKPDYVLESKNAEYFLVIYKESVNKANNLVNYIKNQKLAKFVWCKDSKSCYKKVFGCSAPVRRHTIQLTACEGGLELTIGDKNSKL